jgi:predicted amidophosphoribosyltransferase
MALADWLDLVVPTDCCGCHRPGPPLCRSCRALALAGHAELIPVEVPVVPWVVATGDYAGVLRRLILAHKSRAHPQLGSVLAECLRASTHLLARVVRATGGWRQPVLAVPVPASRRWAGRQPVRELLTPRDWSATNTSPADLLVAARVRRPQKVLSAQQRSMNMHGALRCRSVVRELRGAQVVILDDVVTTGASIAAAAETLTRAGFEVAGAAVIARAR